jgi:predicted tellurium resistance membrane protein TerC
VSFLVDPDIWASLLTLTVLEIVLGIDNLVFISIVAGRLPRDQQPAARQLGLAFALLTRLMLLAGLFWMTALTRPLFVVFDHVVSWRDIVLLSGGLFLIVKGTLEIHQTVEGQDGDMRSAVVSGFVGTVIQIGIMDIIFSLDSVITAIGMAEHLWVMALAICIAIAVMLFAAGPLGVFVERHPTIKMLALSFLLLIGVVLVADGMHFHVPRGYLYFAIAFAIGVESLNLLAARRQGADPRNRERD